RTNAAAVVGNADIAETLIDNCRARAAGRGRRQSITGIRKRVRCDGDPGEDRAIRIIYVIVITVATEAGVVRTNIVNASDSTNHVKGGGHDRRGRSLRVGDLYSVLTIGAAHRDAVLIDSP